jgi:hypothetical protein
MGIKKAGKKLLKLGQKSMKTLGKEGKHQVEALFAMAIEVLEREIQKAAGKKKSRTAKAKKPKGGHAAIAQPSNRPAPVKPVAEPEAKKVAPASGGRARRRPERVRRPAPASRSRPAGAAAEPVKAPTGDGDSSDTGV